MLGLVVHLHERTVARHAPIDYDLPGFQRSPWTGRAEVHEQVGPPASRDVVEHFLEFIKRKALDAIPLREAEHLTSQSAHRPDVITIMQKSWVL